MYTILSGQILSHFIWHDDSVDRFHRGGGGARNTSCDEAEGLPALLHCLARGKITSGETSNKNIFLSIFGNREEILSKIVCSIQ